MYLNYDRDIFISGLKECPKLPHAESEMIHSIMSNILKQLGVDYTGVAAEI